MDTVFIDVRRLVQTLILSLFLPISIALSIDVLYGYMPFCTIFAVTVFIPLSTVIVIRTVLFQMDNMIQEIAPLSIQENVQKNVQTEKIIKKLSPKIAEK